MKLLMLSLALALTLSTIPALAEVGVVALVNLSPAGNFQAKTNSVVGSAKITGDRVSATNIKVPMDSLKTGIELRDRHMKEKYIETTKFPDAELIEATGTAGKGRGKLKFHGVEKEITGTYKIVGNEMQAEFPIKLSEFGITGIRYMGVGVKDDVKVTITVPVTE
ncbi:MAG: YceI family protein [Bdellovibrio sp.]